MKTVSLAPAVLLLTIVLAGCSSNDGPDASPSAGTRVATATPTSSSAPSPSPAPADDLTKTISDYSTAFLTGDGAAAYSLLSERCHDALPLSEFAGVSEQAKVLYGDVKIESMDVAIDGQKAKATYTYAVPAINQKDEPWLLEGSDWKNDDC